MKFLIVEDDEIDYMQIQRSLQKLKISNELIRAKNGVEAQDIINSLNNVPYLILLDLNMPLMNGYEFLDWLRASDQPTTPVVVLTTSSDPEDIKTVYQKCVCGYIVKPIDINKFIEVMSVVGQYWNVCQIPKRSK